jgi:hypothetical protein
MGRRRSAGCDSAVGWSPLLAPQLPLRKPKAAQSWLRPLLPQQQILLIVPDAAARCSSVLRRKVRANGAPGAYFGTGTRSAGRGLWHWHIQRRLSLWSYTSEGFRGRSAKPIL